MHIVILITILAVFSTISVSAQEQTPTAAPSKTPTLIPSPTTENNTTSDNTSFMNPFTQDDLELLVGNVQRPNGIIWYENDLYVVCNGDWTVYRINDTTGDTITFIFGTKNANHLIAENTESGFDLWIPDPDSEVLWKVDHNRSAPASVAQNLVTPWGITRINDNSFLITSSKGNSILEVSESGQINEALTGLRSPTGIAKQDNYIYFGNGGSARRGIEWFEIQEDGTYSDPKSLVSGLQNTTNVVMGQDELLYFAYSLGTRGIVGRINPENCREDGCTNEDVEIVIFSDIPAPIAGLTLSDDMRVFLHSRYRPEIYWVQLPE